MNLRPESLLSRLRRAAWLRAVLCALALATAVSGLHAAWHSGAGTAFPGAEVSTPSGDGGPHDHDCAACRLGLGLGVAIAVAGTALVVLHAAATMHPRAHDRASAWADAVARWRERRKHGPPSFLR